MKIALYLAIGFILGVVATRGYEKFSVRPSMAECMLSEMKGRPVAMMREVRTACQQRKND